jgi:predicted nucleic acid-binding Zn ribbon protein
VPSRRVTEKLLRAWRDASEDSWAQHTRLRHLEGGVLDVGVDSEALRDELANFHRDRLLRVLRAALPDVPLIGIRFLSDPGDGDGV